MKNIILLSIIILSGCSYNTKNDMSGINDELYSVKSNPISINESETKKNEESIVFSDGFTTTISELSDSDKDIALNNQLILFDFDSKNIKSEMDLILKSQINLLLGNPKLRVMLEGRTDERGSKPYNIILGEKRALSVRDYLINNGINKEQILYVSLGENEPLFLELKNNEKDFWTKNRSVLFKYLD